MENIELLALLLGSAVTATGFGFWFWKSKQKPQLKSPPTTPTPAPAPEQSVDEAKVLTPELAPEPASLDQALAKTRSQIFGRIKGLFSSQQNIAPEDIEKIEEILFTSDIGPQTVQRLMGAIEDKRSKGGLQDFSTLSELLKNEMQNIFDHVPARQIAEGHKPTVLMIVGVNGAGKTTTIGKLASQLAEGGRRVLIAAGDTFRAAAREQLKVWSDRAQVEIFDLPETKDPSAVAFGACEKAKNQAFDYVIVDTAGRLHTQKNLMEELRKMKRVIQKVIPEAPHEVLLVLDANSGQNALMQAREFHAALEVTGVVLTKMDGTAKGGVAVGVASELKIPIQWIGVGEKVSDLRPFSAKEFVHSIF